MLILAHCMADLQFSQLKEVYLEENLNKAGGRFGEALLREEQVFYDYLRHVFFRTPGAVYAIWEEKGLYRSALRLEPYREGLLLAGLETAPEHRRKHFGSLLVHEVLNRFAGQRIYSHIAKTNTASLGLHEKAGFRKISDSAAYIDGSVDRRCCTYVYENTAIGN